MLKNKTKTKLGYKHSPIGDIPVDWECTKLDEIGSSTIGLTYTPNVVVEEGGTLVLRSSNILDGRLSFVDKVYVNVKIPEKLYVLPGDILICARNGSRSLIGKCALINYKQSKMTFGAFMSVYRSRYSQFLYHVFNTDIYNRQIYQNLGATINQITTKNLNTFYTPLPPSPEQEKISEILSTWDSAIETTTKLIDAKKKLKKGMMQQLLTGKTRFKEFGKPAKDGELPEGWEHFRASKIFQNCSIKNHGNASVLSVTQDIGLVLRDALDRKINMSKSNTNSYKLVEPGAFIISLRLMGDN